HHSRSSYATVTPRPPPSITPLFPYTTLFRSWSPYAPVPLLRLRPAGRGCVQDRHGEGEAPERNWSKKFSFRHYSLELGAMRSGSDRKSTRLNSSHVKISYAVFCLKKKKSLYYWTKLHRNHTRAGTRLSQRVDAICSSCLLCLAPSYPHN